MKRFASSLLTFFALLFVLFSVGFSVTHERLKFDYTIPQPCYSAHYFDLFTGLQVCFGHDFAQCSWTTPLATEVWFVNTRSPVCSGGLTGVFNIPGRLYCSAHLARFNQSFDQPAGEREYPLAVCKTPVTKLPVWSIIFKSDQSVDIQAAQQAGFSPMSSAITPLNYVIDAQQPIPTNYILAGYVNDFQAPFHIVYDFPHAFVPFLYTTHYTTTDRPIDYYPLMGLVIAVGTDCQQIRASMPDRTILCVDTHRSSGVEESLHYGVRTVQVHPSLDYLPDFDLSFTTTPNASYDAVVGSCLTGVDSSHPVSLCVLFTRRIVAVNPIEAFPRLSQAFSQQQSVTYHCCPNKLRNTYYPHFSRKGGVGSLLLAEGSRAPFYSYYYWSTFPLLTTYAHPRRFDGKTYNGFLELVNMQNFRTPALTHRTFNYFVWESTKSMVRSHAFADGFISYSSQFLWLPINHGLLSLTHVDVEVFEMFTGYTYDPTYNPPREFDFIDEFLSVVNDTDLVEYDEQGKEVSGSIAYVVAGVVVLVLLVR